MSDHEKLARVDGEEKIGWWARIGGVVSCIVHFNRNDAQKDSDFINVFAHNLLEQELKKVVSGLHCPMCQTTPISIQDQIQMAVEDERERCAKIAEDKCFSKAFDAFQGTLNAELRSVAATIRAKPEVKPCGRG